MALNSRKEQYTTPEQVAAKAMWDGRQQIKRALRLHNYNARGLRTVPDQLAVLDARVGPGGAAKERAKLAKR